MGNMVQHSQAIQSSENEFDTTKDTEIRPVNNLEVHKNDTDTKSDITKKINEGSSASEGVQTNDEIPEENDKEESQKEQDLSYGLSTERNKENTINISNSEQECIESMNSDRLDKIAENDAVEETDKTISDNTETVSEDINGQEECKSVKTSSESGEATLTDTCAISKTLEEIAVSSDDENQTKSGIIKSAEELDENKTCTEALKPNDNAQDNTEDKTLDMAPGSNSTNGHEKVMERDVQREKRVQTAKKNLPEWFKVMIGLTHVIHDGKEMEHWEDIRESIDIHGSTQASTVRTNARLIQLIMKRIGRIARRDRSSCSCLPNFEAVKDTFHNKNALNLNTEVQNLLEPIADIDDVDISCEGVRAPCHTGGSALLHIRCTSCQSLYRVVAILNSPLFKDGIVRIKELLEKEMKDKLDIDANITPESIHDVKNHLSEQGILKGTAEFVSCEAHPGKLTEVYCFEHDDICCKACSQSQHSCCHDVTQVTKEDEKKKKRPNLKRKVKECYVRMHSDNGDEGNCDIVAFCMLPNGELIVADMNNQRLKRLNAALQVIDVCDLPGCPRDVCYTGNQRVAVILYDDSIQFVDVSGSLEVKEKVDLDHDSLGVACCGDTLYVTDPMSVYTYSLEGKKKGGLYRQLSGNHRFCRMTVSDNKEMLYIAAREGGLVTIDLEGNQLSSLHGRELGIVCDVCVGGDGSLFVCDSRMQTISRVDSQGKTVLQRVAGRSEDIYMPQSLCYDRHGNRLLVGHLHDDYISVLHIN